MIVMHRVKPQAVYARDLAHAAELGYFSGAMRKEEMMERITRYNPELRWVNNEHYCGLWHTHKGYLFGITRHTVIPQFTVVHLDKNLERKLCKSTPRGTVYDVEIINTDEIDGKILCRGWRATLNMVKKRGYRIDETDIMVY